MHIILKGTLAAAGALVLVGPAIAQGEGGRPINVTLSGAEEVAAADPDGSGTFNAQINPGQRQLCYQLTATDIAPATAAHIHRARARGGRPRGRAPRGAERGQQLRLRLDHARAGDGFGSRVPRPTTSTSTTRPSPAAPCAAS
jgi:hypothetical protein